MARRPYYIAGGIVVLSLLYAMTRRALVPITKNQRIRGKDAFGSGTFQASRDGGSRLHSGVDIVATAGQAIYAPVTGKITRLAYPYASDLSYTGLEIINDDYNIKIFYIAPTVAIGSQVAAGQKIAVAQHIAAKYGAGMINHVHIEIRNKNGELINPTNLF